MDPDNSIDGILERGPDHFIQGLKEKWKAAKYTPPDEDTDHLLTEEHPDYEPIELSQTCEEELARKVIEEGTFPSKHQFHAMMQEWCLKTTLTNNFEFWAPALNDHHELVYESVARLFYMSLTDEFETKARRIGEELDARGGMPLMQVVYYGVSHAAKSASDELPESDPAKMGAVSTIYYMVSDAFNGVGDWRN